MRAGILVFAVAVGCLAPVAGAWTDDPNDLLLPCNPALDLLEVNVRFTPSQVIFDLVFNPALAQPADLYFLLGFIDLDIDSNPLTGDPSHFFSFNVLPVPEMGIEYCLSLYGGPEPFAELSQIIEGSENSLGFFPIIRSGMMASVIVDRCAPGELTGLPMSANYAMALLLGNGENCERAPNGAEPFRGEPAPGDINADGLVDQSDLDFFDSCRSGPGIFQDNTACDPMDFDHDHDVDQDDFGVFQLNWTG